MGLSVLLACGSGPEGVVDLSGDDSQAGCGTTVSKVNLTTGSITTGDRRATLTASNAQIPISVSITVDCSEFRGQIGHAYVLDISQTFVSVLLNISYEDIDLKGVDPQELELGTYDTVNKEWRAASNTTPDLIGRIISVSAPISGRYALFTQSPVGGEDSIKPTKPIIQRVTPSGSSLLVTWAASSDPGGGVITGYILSRRPPGTQVSTVQGTQLSFLDTGQTAPFDSNPQSYCYSIVAVDDDGDRSDPSDERCSPFFAP